MSYVRNITSGRGIVCSGGGSSVPYINMSNPSAGMVRYNGNNLEVYDGSSWLTMTSSYYDISLDADTIELLEWARSKRDEELRLKQLAAKYPAMQDAIDALNQAKEKVQVVAALVNNT